MIIIIMITTSIEGRDYNNIQNFYMCNEEHTGFTQYLGHGESIAVPLTCEVSIKPLQTIPTVANEAMDGAQEGHHQSNYPHQGSWNPDICPG